MWKRVATWLPCGAKKFQLQVFVHVANVMKHLCSAIKMTSSCVLVWTMRPNCVYWDWCLWRNEDLVTCYKYINGFTDVDMHYFSSGLCLRTRSSHNQKLQIQLFSFFNHVVLAWNYLPNFVISAQNPILFRKHLSLYYSLGH